MEKNRIETVYRGGKTWEVINSAARRYMVSVKTIEEHLDKELFWAKDPRTGVYMVCGALTEGSRCKERNYSKYVWFAFWLGVGGVSWGISGFAGFLLIGLGVGIIALLPKMDMKEMGPKGSLMKRFWESIPACDDGGVMGWSVPSSAAKADMDWMFGSR